MKTIREQLPEIYRPLLPAFFDAPGVVETKATCDRCVMIPPAGAASTGGVDYFNPVTKCCTYQPKLPNYLVGGILADDTPEMAEGRRRVAGKVAAKIGVTPRWLAPAKKYTVLLEQTRATCFGRSATMRCPYFVEGDYNCTVWKYREADCTTFFCRNDAGEDGRNYWIAFDDYLRLVETKLSRWAAAAVAPALAGNDGEHPGLTLEELEDRAPREDSYRELWGDWLGREESFYRACAEAVRGLDAARFAAILADDEPARRLTVLRERHDAVRHPRIPERLRPNPKLEVLPGGPEGTRVVVGYARYEPVALPDIIYRLLAEFSGRETVREVQARILRDEDADFTDELVVKMLQLRILCPADAETGAAR